MVFVLLAGAALGCRPTPAVEPIRLIEQRPVAWMDWPDSATIAGDLPRAVIGGLGDPRRVVEVEIHKGSGGLKDSRTSLLAPPNGSYTFELQLPRRPLLRLAFAVLPNSTESEGALTFRVSIAPAGGDSSTVLEQNLDFRSDLAWEEHQIDLGRWEHQSVSLTLETNGSSGAESVWGAWATPEIVSSGQRPSSWDVILISLDTLRADHLGSYGHHRPTSPNLDALAARGIRFSTAVSQSPWTRPSHDSLFRGLYPASRAGLRSRPLAEVLWENGFRTGAITAGGQVDARFGFHRGFETYRVDQWLRNPELVVDYLAQGRDRNDLLFLHTFEIHDPYTDTRFAEGMPPGRIRDEFAARHQHKWRNRITDEEKRYAEALYDGGIAFTDERVGIVLDDLEREGLLERTIVIVTSDHGEAFWEHGTWRHGATMYEHQLRVPLIVYLPKALRKELGTDRGLVVEQQVQLVDLYPTLLDLLGIELDHKVQGRSLLPLLEGEAMAAGWAFAENTGTKSFERKAFRTDRYKFVYSYPKKRNRTNRHVSYQLFDLVEDPEERVNVADLHPELVESFMAQLQTLRQGQAEQLQETVPEGLDAELEERLRALGYVEN